MVGAILGDMIGAPYEFDKGSKTKEFPLFSMYSQFTDDSVMTIAVAEAMLGLDKEADEDTVRHEISGAMRKWGKKYPDAGYGRRFYDWLFDQEEPSPYGSCGNGSAMRVSSAGWLYDTIDETRKYARLSAEVTHNHPEGIKGAEATASAIFLARNGASKDEIRNYIIREFDYDLSRTCDEIRSEYYHVETCQQTVPEAITAFLEGEDFEDVIRTAVSLGGDCDTLTCIAGSIAEAFYGIQEEMETECRNRLPEDMLEVLDRFTERIAIAGNRMFHDPFLEGNDLIENAIEAYYGDTSKENLTAVLESIRKRMHEDGHFIFPIQTDGENEERFSFRGIRLNDGRNMLAAFTSREEYEKGEESKVLSYFIDAAMKNTMEMPDDGFIINPWGRSFLLTKDLIERIFQADDGVEYTVPDDTITEELLEDGSFLKRAIEICNRNRTELNLLKLLRILRDSTVWIPCRSIVSEEDSEELLKMIEDAGEDPEALVGITFQNKEPIRMVPDILENGGTLFFPVFTSEEETGEYGEHLSKMPCHFLDAIVLARNNENDIAGIVINAFTDPFVVNREVYEIVEKMESSIEEKTDTE